MVRPLKWTLERQKRIIDAITAGNYAETAARYGGISPTTYYDWMVKGRKERSRRETGEEPNTDLDWAVDFTDAVEEALAKAEVASIALISKAARDGTWQAAAWLLERRYPQRFGRVTRIEGTTPDATPVRVETVSVADLESKVRTILGATGDNDDDSD